MSKKADFLFFNANWCPDCRDTLPVWEKLIEKIKTTNIGGYNLIFTKIECSLETPDNEKLIEKYNVDRFPTIKLLKDGKVYDIDTSPTKTNIAHFINVMLENGTTTMM